MYTLKFGREHFGYTMYQLILDNSKVQYNNTKAAKTHRSIISNSLLQPIDVYRISIVEQHIGILLCWPMNFMRPKLPSPEYNCCLTQSSVK